MAAPVGLDIGSSAIRAVQVKQGRQGSTIERIGQIDLPHGAVHQGEIVDADAVVTALTQLWKKFKIRSRKVAVGLSNQRVVVRRLDLPYMTEDELRSSLSLQVDGLIPMSVDNAVMDFCVLAERETDEGERQLRILLVAAQRQMVDDLLSVVKQAKLQPVSVDLDAFAALHSLAGPGLFGESGAEMVVDVGGTVTDLVVHIDGSPYFARTLLFGGAAITERLMNELDMDRPSAEALKLGREDELYDEHSWDSVDQHVRDEVQHFVDEIRGSIDYCATQADIPKIERIVLTGGSSQVPQLAEMLAEGVGLDVATASPLDVLDASKATLAVEDREAEAPRFAVAVGLAMGAGS